jgi:hypothetical protein
MKSEPPRKYKCLDCKSEEWIKLQECCCYDICTCSQPKCKVCGGILVQKSRFNEEVKDIIIGELSQIYEWDECINPKENSNINHAIDLTFKWLKKLK